MSTSPKLWSLCLIPFAVPALGACASSSSGGGERGLADLRAALDLYPVVGHVERDASGTWLVYNETNVRLARVPDSAATGPDACKAKGDGHALVFQGGPGVAGAALVLGEDGAVVARYDAAKGCVVDTAIAADTLVTPTQLVATRWTFDLKKPAESSPPANLSVEAHLDLDGRPSGVDVVLTPTSVAVQPGVSRAPALQPASIGGEPLFEATAVTSILACGGTYSSNIQRGVMPDGRTLLRYEITAEGTMEDYGGGCGGDDDVRTSKSVDTTWLVLPRDGGPAVVVAAAEQSSDSDGNSHDAHHQTYTLPVGQLRLDSSYDQEVGSRNGGSTTTWSWTYVPPTGAELTLYSVGGY